MDFDTTYNVTLSSDECLEYGIVYGNENIVFIKSGAGGTARGYKDKYVTMARRLYERGNFTVISAPNPITEKMTYDIDELIINKIINDKKFDNYTINLIGSSNGGYQNILLAEKLSSVKKMISINMPLMLNFQKATTKLMSLNAVEKIFVYGTLDPSFPFTPLLNARKINKLNILTIEGADHQFVNKLNEFIDLCDLV